MHILYTNISIIKSKGPFLLSTWQGETYPCTKSPFLSRLDDVVPRLSWGNYWQTPNPSSDTFQTRLSNQSLNPSNSHPNVVHSHVFAFFHVFWVIFSSFICFHLNKAWLQDHHVCFEGQDFGDNLQPGKHHSAQRWDVGFWVKALAKKQFLCEVLQINANKLEHLRCTLSTAILVSFPCQTEQNTCRTEWHQCNHTCKIAKSAKSVRPLMVHVLANRRIGDQLIWLGVFSQWFTPNASRHNLIPFCEVINPWVWHHPEFATSFIQEPTCDHRKITEGKQRKGKRVPPRNCFDHTFKIQKHHDDSCLENFLKYLAIPCHTAYRPTWGITYHECQKKTGEFQNF